MSYCVKVDDKTLYEPLLQSEGYIIISPSVTKAKNKAGSFTFKIPPTNPLYDQLKKLKSIISVYKDGDIFWKGRVLDERKDFNKIKEVTCEGELAFLNDIIVAPYDYSEKGMTINEFFQYVMELYAKNCSEYRKIQPGYVYNVDSDTRIYPVSTTYENVLSTLSSKLIDVVGGVLVFRYQNGESYLDYYGHISDVIRQKIEFGKNLINLEEYVDATDVYTYLIPLGKQDDEGNYLDITSVNSGLKYIYSKTGENLYGKITKSIEYSDIEDATLLKQKAEAVLADAIKEATTITIKAVDLRVLDVDTDAIDVNCLVNVVSPPHEINSNFECTEITFDLSNVANNEYTFGSDTKTLTEMEVESSAVTRLDTEIQNTSSYWDIRKQLKYAIQSADGKTTNYYSPNPPYNKGGKVGDTWFDTDDDNRMYTWDGEKWVSMQFGFNAIKDKAIGTTKIGDNAVTWEQIEDLAVTAEKLADAAVTAEKIKNEVIAAEKLVDGCITAEKIKDKVIASSKLVDGCITAEKIKDKVIASSKLVDGCITADKIKDKVITATKIVDGCITADQIKDAAINGTKIEAAAIGTAHIQNGAIDNAKIANGAIDNAKIGTAAIDTVNIVDGAIDNAKIANGAIDNAKIGTAAIETTHIKDGAIDNAKIANGAIDNAKIGTAAIDTVNIKDGAINNAKIANGEVTNAKIKNGAIDSAKIKKAAIGTACIADAAITSALIKEGSILNAHIANAAITSAKIANAAITNAHIANAAIETAMIKDGAINNAKISNMDAGKITTGTLNAARVAIGDMTNFATVTTTDENSMITDDGGTKVSTVDSEKVLVSAGLSNITAYVMMCTYTAASFISGDKIHAYGRIYTSIAQKVGIGIWFYDTSRAYVTYRGLDISTSVGWNDVVTILTLNDLPSNAVYFKVGFVFRGSGTRAVKYAVFKQVATNLIVGDACYINSDGSFLLGPLQSRGSDPANYDLVIRKAAWVRYGLEILGSNESGTPYIDFHYGEKDYDGTNTDYSARICETSPGVLTVHKTISETSDGRLKENIVDIPDVYMKLVERLKPKMFNFIGYDFKTIGLIAQDVLAIEKDLGITESVLVRGTGESDDYYSLDYNALSVLMWTYLMKKGIVENNEKEEN